LLKHDSASGEKEKRKKRKKEGRSLAGDRAREKKKKGEGKKNGHPPDPDFFAYDYGRWEGGRKKDSQCDPS